MPTLSRRSTLALLLALPLSACHFGYVAPNPNDPLRGVRNFIIEPLAYPAVVIGDQPEAAYLARKDEKQRSSWEVDKGESAARYAGTALMLGAQSGLSVAPPPPPGPGFFVLRPLVSFFEPGNFNGFFNKNTAMRITVQIFNDQAQQVDQVELATVVQATLANPSSGGRMRTAAEDLGRRVINMVSRRSAGLPY